MDLTFSISSTLIVIGAILMLINIISHRHTVKSTRSYRDRDSRLTRSLIRTHMAFMGFFFVGYILVLFLFLNHITFDSSVAVAIIFFFGAIFVFLGIIIQKRMLSSLEDKNAKLKKTNDTLLAEQEHLLQLNRQLELEMDSRVKAEESDQMKSDFLSLVSHELRTPLTSIYGFTKLIGKNLTKLDKGDGADYATKKKRMKANLEIIGSECARLSRLINNVLDLAKIESGRVEWNDQRISLRHIIDSSQAAVQGLVIG